MTEITEDKTDVAVAPTVRSRYEVMREFEADSDEARICELAFFGSEGRTFAVEQSANFTLSPASRRRVKRPSRWILPLQFRVAVSFRTKRKHSPVTY
jgi:hypothetical protein